jgi:hypothetical protein
MEQNTKTALLNGAVIRTVLILVALAAFVLAAGAPMCMGC